MSQIVKHDRSGKDQPRVAILWVLAVLSAVCVVPALWVDMPVARQLSKTKLPGELHRAVNYCEGFGHGFGAAVALVLAWQLAPQKRRRIARAACMVFTAGMAANFVKMLVVRTRPRAADLSLDVWHTFQGWFAAGLNTSGQQSFPSGHTATAVALAIALGWLFPRARVTFVVLAVVVAFQRMYSMAHFLSDVLAGAALAFAISALCLQKSALGRWFDRWETGPCLPEGVSAHKS